MNEEIKKLIEQISVKSAAGGAIDSSQVEAILEKQLKQAMANPEVARAILDNILQQPQDKKVMKLKQIAKEQKSGETQEDLTPSALESKIIDDLLQGNNVYLYGYAGTGKTFMAKKIAKYLQKSGAIPDSLETPYWLINCSQWTSPINILGGFTIDGYSQGIAIEAWSKGGVLILDELPKLDPNTAGLLNEMLASRNEKNPIVLDGEKKTHRMHPSFFVIGAGNTDLISIGDAYGGNNVQDYSLFDRFAGSMYTIEAETAAERKIVKYNIVLAISWALRKFCVEQKGTHSISIRTMENFARIYELEMLRKIFGGEIIDGVAYYQTADGNKAVAFNDSVSGTGKTFVDNINSFIKTFPTEQQRRIEGLIIGKEAEFQEFEGKKFYDALSIATNDNFIDVFIKDFIANRGWNPETGKWVGFKLG